MINPIGGPNWVKFVNHYGIVGNAAVAKYRDQNHTLKQEIRETVFMTHSNRNTNRSEPQDTANPPELLTAIEHTAATELFNAIAKGDDVRWEIRHPLEDSVVSVGENTQAKISYPWNPAAPESDAFFPTTDSDSLLNSFDSSELDQQANRFFNHLDQLWDKSLQTQLARKFATVPTAIIASIAQQAQQAGQQVIQQSSQRLDQLAQIVQTALPQWAIEDLQVLARPMAYAMRGENPEIPPNDRDWNDLSATEQAKLSLTIARYALDQTERA
jgi:hypothetical protein